MKGDFALGKGAEPRAHELCNRVVGRRRINLFLSSTSSPSLLSGWLAWAAQSNVHLVRGWRRGWGIPRCSSLTSRTARWSWPSSRTSGCRRKRHRSRGREVPASILLEWQRLEQRPKPRRRREGGGVPRGRRARDSGLDGVALSSPARRRGGRRRSRRCGIGLACLGLRPRRRWCKGTGWGAGEVDPGAGAGAGDGYRVAWSPNGTRLAVAGGDGVAVLTTEGRILWLARGNMSSCSRSYGLPTGAASPMAPGACEMRTRTSSSVSRVCALPHRQARYLFCEYELARSTTGRAMLG